MTPLPASFFVIMGVGNLIAPKLRDYDINVLAIFGNKEKNEINRNQIKLLIVEKILNSTSSMFILLNRFVRSNDILKESYAEVITMLMKDSDYLINNMLIDEIVTYVSLDNLIYYGAESKNDIFGKKCLSEFWRRASVIEDRSEINRKNGLKRKRKKDNKNIEKKGDIK